MFIDAQRVNSEFIKCLIMSFQILLTLIPFPLLPLSVSVCVCVHSHAHAQVQECVQARDCCWVLLSIVPGAIGMVLSLNLEQINGLD